MSVDKTKELIRITSMPLSMMVKNEANPNKMSSRAFDLLVANISQHGWTEPVLLRPISQTYEQLNALVATECKKLKKTRLAEDQYVALFDREKVKFRIVGGHHRYDAGQYLGFQAGPATIIMDPDFDDEAETFMIVKMNTIHGKLDSQMFVDMYSKLAGKYADDVMQEMFGFDDEAEFQKLVKSMAKTLPKEMQEKFIDAAKEEKTIDGLSKLLSKIINTYGDTLPYSYMVFDHGGKRALWLRASDKTMKSVDLLGMTCIDKQRTMDDVVGRLLQLVASGELADVLDRVVKETPPVKLPKGLAVPATKDNLESIDKVS